MMDLSVIEDFENKFRALKHLAADNPSNCTRATLHDEHIGNERVHDQTGNGGVDEQVSTDVDDGQRLNEADHHEVGENVDNEEMATNIDDNNENVHSSGGFQSESSVRWAGEFWTISDEVGYLSDFCNSNRKVLSSLQQYEREVIDYTFFLEDDKGELLFAFKDVYNLSRDDLLTMNKNSTIMQTVVTAFCLTINDADLNTVYSRFVFNVEHSRSLSGLVNCKGNAKQNAANLNSGWKNWFKVNKQSFESVDLIFVPFCCFSHYDVLCIYFVDCKVHYLDNLPSEDANTYLQCAEVLQKQMSLFLASQKHPKAKEIMTYAFEDVQFPWKNCAHNSDCGIFMMHHIKYFDGDVYSSPDLCPAESRLLLRAQFCGDIILSNLNESKVTVLSHIYMFYKNKPFTIRQSIERKKKLAEEKKAEQLKLAVLGLY